MASYGTENRVDKQLRMSFWLIIARNANGRPTARVTAADPNLARNERAIRLEMKLPFALFETPAITASITVAEPDTAASIDLTALAETVRQAIGLDVDMKVLSNEN